MREIFHSTYKHFGPLAVLQLAAARFINRWMRLERLIFVALPRQGLRPPQGNTEVRFSASFASAEQLARLARDPVWQINSVKLDNFRAGDCCLLSFVDGQLAGCGWASTRASMEITPGLIMTLPANYLYSYAGLTLRPYQGLGLQSFRHRTMLEEPRWSHRMGLFSFARHTNFASRASQRRSGFQAAAVVWVIGVANRFVVIRSPGAHRLGLRRILPLGDVSGVCG
jgi:hypothetical protein